MNKRISSTILSLIGNTPLIRLDLETDAKVYAKLEYFNPGGSIKDRSALFMVEKAEAEGKLRPGGTIVEASSGNQGIALAMIGAVKDYKVFVTVPDRTSTEKISTLRAYGAKVYVCPDTDTLDNPEGYHAKAEELLKKIPGAFMPNQYFNIANPQAHYSTTGPEIWKQTNGKVTHVVIGMGSCGTITGIGRFLKEQNSDIKIIGVDAATSALSSKCPKAYKVEGLGVDVMSDTLDRSVIDIIETITDDEAFEATKHAAQFGLLIGISSGAVLHIAQKHAPNLKQNDVMVIIFADSGRSYLSKVFNF
jgi:cystathionine beta-synthase